MGGCCSSSRKAQLHGTPVYYYCSPALEEREPHDGEVPILTAGLLVDPNLEMAASDIYRPPPRPVQFDVLLGCPRLTEETVRGDTFSTLATCQLVEGSNCKSQPSSLFASPKKFEVLTSKEPNVPITDDEDVCPICLEEYDDENPRNITTCQHHFHLSCILEWMERSDTCPMCDQEVII